MIIVWKDCIDDRLTEWSDTEFEFNERVRILESVSLLAESVGVSGVCTDEALSVELGDLIETELQNVSSLCINRQRDLWMNTDGIMKPGVFMRVKGSINFMKERTSR
jgi:hypothetical protein